jgi:hypothetical protein
MFAHHLYAFNDRFLNGNSYVPFIPFFNAELYVGRFGSICVSIFLRLDPTLGWCTRAHRDRVRRRLVQAEINLPSDKKSKAQNKEFLIFDFRKLVLGLSG